MHCITFYGREEEYLGIGPLNILQWQISQWNILTNAAYSEYRRNKKELEHEELTRYDLYNGYIMTRSATNGCWQRYLFLAIWPAFTVSSWKIWALFQGKQMNRKENNLLSQKCLVRFWFSGDLFFDREKVHGWYET